MLLSFLFWNVKGKDLSGLIAETARLRGLDVVMLAELKQPDQAIAQTLESLTGAPFHAISDPGDKVRIFSRMPVGQWRKRQSDPLAGLAIWSVTVGPAPGITLVTAHCRCRLNASADEQALMSMELAKEVLAVEESVGHDRTIVVGDLNMNPHDLGLTGSNTLHAVMTTQIAGRRSRQVQNRTYKFFYNPMWSCFGDRSAGPAGTYYHRSPSPAEQFWHNLDQVLLRPDVMDSLRFLEIVDRIGETSLLTVIGLPDSRRFSDHLPLTITLEL